MFAPAYMGRKRILQMLSLHAQEFSLMAAVFFALVVVTFEGACAGLFRPTYAGANMGHPSRTKDCSWEIKIRQTRRLDKCEQT
jgi:hypothetical protein